MTRQAKMAKATGAASWEPSTKAPLRFPVPPLGQSAPVRDGLALLKRSTDSEAATYRQNYNELKDLLWMLLFMPGGGAPLLAEDIRRVEVETARVKAHNQKWPDAQIGPVDPCGSAGRKREWLSMLSRDAFRDLNQELRGLNRQIQAVENRIADRGKAVSDELVRERMKLEDRIIDLVGLIDVRDTMRGPLEDLCREKTAAAIKGLTTALGNMVEEHPCKVIRKILFGNAAVYRLLPHRIPDSVEAPFRVILEADVICDRLRHPSGLWRRVFVGLDRDLQFALADRLNIRLGSHLPESHFGVEETDPLLEINRQAMQT